MMTIPDRLKGLIEKVEAGQPVTHKDLGRLATLQALDLAKLGEDFSRETIQRDDQLVKDLEALGV